MQTPRNELKGRETGRDRSLSCSSSESDVVATVEASPSNASSGLDRLDTPTPPIGPSISRAPSFVRHRDSINGAVTTAMQTVTQLHVLLNQPESSRRNLEGGDDMSMSDDGMTEEETCLREAEESMRREMECLDRLLMVSPPAPPQLHAPSAELDTTASLEGERSDEEEADNATFCSPEDPSPETTNQEDYLCRPSPTGVADLLDPTGSVTIEALDDGNKVRSQDTILLERSEFRTPPRTIKTFAPTIQSQGRHNKEGTTSPRQRSFLSDITNHETTTVVTTEMESFQRTDTTQAALHRSDAASESLIASIAWLAFGQQQRQCRSKAVPTKHMAGTGGDGSMAPRTRLCVAAAAAAAAATAATAAVIVTSALCGSRLLLTEGPFLAAMTLLTLLATVLEVKLP